MPKPKPVSAGLLVYRVVGSTLEVLLVHPSGAYNRNAAWSIPKGMPDAGEEHEGAARRETLEETGVRVTGVLTPLGSIDYRKSRKTVVAFAVAATSGDSPRPASWEVDRAEFVPLERARELLHEDQRAFIERLLDWLARS